jgi:hypothetical protein
LEGVVWTGHFVMGSAVAISADAIYINGGYENSYQNGSVPKPTTNPGFVARYDLQGNQIWFKEYLINSPADTTLGPISVSPGPMAFNSNGDLLVAVRTPTSRAWMLLRLKASDGSML